MIVIELDLSELSLLSGALGALSIQAKNETAPAQYDAILARCQALLLRFTNVYNATQIGGSNNEHVIN